MLLKVEGLEVYYDQLQVLYDVGLEVKEGEIVSLVGSNASGKSTLLKTISGLLKPKKGDIYFKGDNIVGMSPGEIVERGIIHVPEGCRVFPQMSVRDNLYVGAYAMRARKHLKESLDEVVEILPLFKERMNQLAGTMSGGERQMLAIGRGLMGKPELLILDEPSLGLAPIIVSQVFQLAKDINKAGTSVLLVEQNVRQSLQMANRAFLLAQGRIKLRGTGPELLQHDELHSSYLGRKAKRS